MKREDRPSAESEKHLVSRFENAVRKGALPDSAVRAFQKIIYDHYRKHARNFPWRATDNPYHILVSEIMLQQTQTKRVTEQYEQFITAFPGFSALAEAPLRPILQAWEGLGYNRRAIALKKIAEIVMSTYNGILPADPEELMALPGIGRASASAIAAFAFNKPAVFIETNIRSVFIHFFFRDQNGVTDAAILSLVKKTLDTSNPRKWYYALMDYGVMLKKTHPDLGSKSAHYQRQARFKNSNRQLRGMILRVLLAKPRLSLKEITAELNVSSERVKSSLAQLQEEGFIKKRGKTFTIA
jgi:A/G-specific adenine glycosylase